MRERVVAALVVDALILLIVYGTIIDEKNPGSDKWVLALAIVACFAGTWMRLRMRHESSSRDKRHLWLFIALICAIVIGFNRIREKEDGTNVKQDAAALFLLFAIGKGIYHDN
jgi:hypothetical protein